MSCDIACCCCCMPRSNPPARQSTDDFFEDSFAVAVTRDTAPLLLSMHTHGEGMEGGGGEREKKTSVYGLL